MRRSLFAGALLVAALALPAAAAAGMAKLTQLLRRETSGLAALESLSNLIVRSEQDLEEARFHSRRLDQQIGDGERRRAAIEKRLQSRRQQVKLRVQGLYKMSRGGLLRMLLETPDEKQLSSHLSAASLILRRDASEITAFNRELQRLREERARLEQARAARAYIVRKLAAKQSVLRAARAEQLAVLRRVERTRRLQEELAGELDKKQQALLREIKELQWRVRVAGGFASLKGKLPRPVGGPVVSLFGQYVARGALGVTLLRHGFTYHPSQHEAVHVVADGLVRVARPFEGYGRLVVVEHSDGFFSLYGFLGSTLVKEGERVRRTDRVGRAGIDPLTGQTATYFELRHRERPLDPSLWLRP